MLILLALLLSSTLSVPSCAEHEFYVSVIEVTHSSVQESVEFRCRIFSDDLQTGLQSEFDLKTAPPLDELCTVQNDNLVAFFRHHVSVQINDIERKIEHVQCTPEVDIHEIKWVVRDVRQIKTMTLQADFLMDIYPDQTQMVHASSDDQKRTLRLTRHAPGALIEFRN